MKNLIAPGLLILLVFFSLSCGRDHDFQRSINFNDGWKFHLGDVPAASKATFNDSSWRELTLPHDWAIEHPVARENPGGTANGFFRGGIGWYRKTFKMDKKEEGQSIYLLFDGIFMDSEIWLNDSLVGSGNYGYINHVYDISELLIYSGENTLAVRVDNSIQPSDRWYHGCGIYRDVEMVIASPIHIKPWGTYIRNRKIESDTAMVDLSIELKSRLNESREIKVISHIYHPEDGRVAVAKSKSFELKGEMILDQVIQVERPDLWSPENPVVYECVTDILTPGNTILDTYITKFGIRDVEFDPEKGFVLNGEKVMMKGVCLHHDLGAAGAAYYPSMMRRRLEILKEAGVNAIRLSHNPYASHTLSLCDEMGFIVFNELYDKWETEWWEENPLRKPFMNTWKKDLTDFVKRDRNHPSVVIWSAGNETMEQLKEPERGVEILRMLRDEFKNLDPERAVTCAMHPHGELPSRLIHETEVVSYNYQVELFDEWRKQYPDYIFLGSETKVYWEENVESWDKLDFSRNTWFMLGEPDVGQFIWAGIDYLGESRGWPDKGIRSGFINSCGYMKPYGYFQKSIYSEEPVVHITVLDEEKKKELENTDTWQILWYGPPLSDHWNYTADSVDVYIFSNLETIKLYLDDELYATHSRKDFPDGVVSERVPYTPGEIKAIASNGISREEHVIRTAGEPHSIYCKIIEYPESNDYEGIIQCEISVRDTAGNLCPIDGINILSEHDENLRFIGADNGDMSDHTLFTEKNRETRDGRCLFVFKRKDKETPYELTFKANNLKSWDNLQ